MYIFNTTRYSLNDYILPVLVQSIVEDVNRLGVNNFLRKFVPMADYSVAEEILSGISSRHLLTANFMLWPLRTEVVSSIAEFNKFLHVHIFFAGEYLVCLDKISPCLLYTSPSPRD